MIPSVGGTRVEREEAVPLQVRSANVLILDEALPVRRALTEILGKLGVVPADIHEAETPEEALAKFTATMPRVVFTEFIGVHPDEGLDMIHAMLDAKPDAKIVLLTSEPRDAPEVRAAIRAGVFAHVEKPIRHDKIRAILSELDSEEGGVERYR